jgi:WD40 repeat protein/transcriptional regulator with XRE-family HTH domain
MAESFGSLLLRYGGRTGLTLDQLADRAGVSPGTLQEWQSDAGYPNAEQLRALLAVLLEAGGLSDGQELAEVQALWARVSHPDSRVEIREGTHAVERWQDWGDAPDDSEFVGRAAELAMLRNWVLEDRCRLLAIVGMAGIGKTSLAARLAHDIGSTFERVYWRSLRDAPLPSDWLGDTIGFLSDQQLTPPSSQAERLAALLRLLRDHRCLLVLDNFETLFQPDRQPGLYRTDLDGYGRLLLAVGEATHQSCLVLTSREAPEERAVFYGGGGRTFRLGGLAAGETQALLAPKQLEGTSTQWAELTARFGGNGLALKLVAETIHERFGGHIGPFLDNGSAGIFEGVRQVLQEQVDSRSAGEQAIMRALAVEREPVPLKDLLARVGSRFGRGVVLEAAETLRRRTLIERAETPGPAAFTLQPVVLEYVTERLVATVVGEIESRQPRLLVEQPLTHARASDYVRLTQERLIGGAILQALNVRRGKDNAESGLLGLLDGWRGRPHDEQGYGPGNVVNLLRLLRGDLRGLDLSHLVIRQAYMAEVDAQDVSLVDSELAEAVIADFFGEPLAVALSGDGALLGTGTPVGEVWLWQTVDRTPTWVARGHTGMVWGVALSSDGHLLASGGADGLVRLWDTARGRPLATLEGHTDAVWSVALSANGRLLASGGADGTVRVWDTQTMQPVATLPEHGAAVWAVALSADGSLLASSGSDGTIRLWEAPTGRALATLPDDTGGLRMVSLSGDGRLLASGGADGTTRLWETATGRQLASLEGHVSGIRSVSLDGDGRLLASGSADGTTRLWETHSGRPIATLQHHTAMVWAVALSADGHLLASGAADGTMRLWDAKTSQPLSTFQGHAATVACVALSGDGRLLASSPADGTLHLWESNSGSPVARLHGHTATVWGLALSGDARLVASAGADGTPRLWDTGTGRQLALLEGHAGTAASVALSAAGDLMASGGADGTVRLWDTATARLLSTLDGHAGTVWGVALSADGHLVASGAADGMLRLWNTDTRRSVAVLHGHSGMIRGVALSADGRLLASGGADGTARLWDTDTGLSLVILHGHAGTVWAVALSADGGLLASGGTDGTVRLWDTRRRVLLLTLQGHTGTVMGVALSADRGKLASCGADGTVRVWDPNSGACLRVLRSDRRYERLDMTHLTGITAAQRASLLALGAFERYDAGRAAC